MSTKIFHVTVATLVGAMAVAGIAIAQSPATAPLFSMLPSMPSMAQTGCESPAALHLLKDLARRKLSDPSNMTYLLGDHVRPALPPSQPGTAEEFIFKRKIQEISIAAQLVVTSGEGTLVLTPSAIRDQGNLASGRTCAAFIKVDAPPMGSTPALVFEIATTYSVERTNDGQIVVSARFSPK